MKKGKRYVQRVGCKQGVVSEILEHICKNIDNFQNKTFVDLFGGGGSISANATYMFRNVIYNEINKPLADLFVAVQDNEFLNRCIHRRVTREEFLALDENILEDNLLKTAWSFGNGRKSYIYGKNIERRKYITHRICFCQSEQEYKELIGIYNDENLGRFEKYGAEWICYLPDDDWGLFSKAKNRRTYKFGAGATYTRKFIKEFDVEWLKRERGELVNQKDKQLVKDVEKVTNQLESLQRLQRLESLQRLQRLESLERLERLESLQRLERLESLESLESLEKIRIQSSDYRDVVLPDPNDCVIYLDPPYRNTAGYEIAFDFEQFDAWVMSKKQQGYDIFVSEYSLPYGEVIWSKTKRGMIAQKKDSFTGKECLFKI